MVDNNILKILLVDDEEEIALVVKKLLNKINENLKISIITDVKTAIAEIAKNFNDYDIVVSDYIMGEKNGIDFLIEIRKMSIDIPFIILTGQGEEEVAMRALNEGCDFYLIKNSNIELIIEKLNHYLMRIENRLNREKIIRDKDKQLEIANEALNLTLNQFEIILGGINVGIYALNLSGELIYVNKKGANDLGYLSPNKMLEKTDGDKKLVFNLLDIYNPTYFDSEERKFNFPNVDDIDKIALNLISTKKISTSSWISKRIFPLFNSSHDLEMVIVITHDISELIQKESLIQSEIRLSLIVNEAIDVFLKSKSKKELMNDFCKILVEKGDYILAWIGQAENKENNKIVEPVSRYGFEDGFLSNINITWDDSESGKGPTGEAIRTEKYSVINDIQNNPKFNPWRENALKRGYHSSLALPFQYIENELGVSGSVNIYSAERNVFSKREIEVLENMVRILSTGLNTITNINMKFDSDFEKIMYFFDELPVPLIQDDFTNVIDFVNEKRKLEIDFQQNLDKNSEFINECISLVRIRDINQKYIELIRDLTKKPELTKEEIIDFLSNTYYSSSEAKVLLKEILISILEGKKSFLKKSYPISKKGVETKVVIKVLVDSQIVDDVGVIFAIIEVS